MTQKLFQQRQLAEALSVTSRVKERLEPFIAQICKGNIEWTFLVFSQLHQYLTQPDAQLNLKFNSLVATKIILDSCQFPAILIVEVYFLPLIKKIACYQINLPQKMRGIDYFLNNGYEKSNTSKKLGYNFVRLACEIINFFSIIKPYELYKFQEVSSPSQFAEAFQAMHHQGWKQFDELAFYHQNPLKMRSLYLQKLESFQDNLRKYSNFFRSSLQNIVCKDLLPMGLDPRKIVQFNEIYACNFTLQLLKQFALRYQAVTLTNVFRLLSEMIRWGRIGAIYAIEYQNAFDSFIQMIKKSQTEGEEMGDQKMSFERIVGTEQQKLILYVQILKSLEIWAACIPKNLLDNKIDSKSTRLFKTLAFECGVKFPIVSNIKKIRNQSCQNMEKHKRLNQRWLQQKLHNSQVSIHKNRRTTTQLRQLLNTPTGKIRKSVAFCESPICRQMSKDSIHQRNLRDTNLTQSQKTLQNVLSPRSSITDDKKCPFTQKFYRQKKRKVNHNDGEIYSPYLNSQSSNFKTARFDNSQREKRRCSVADSIHLVKMVHPNFRSFSKASSDISDEQSLYTQQVEQGKTETVIKSMENKMLTKNLVLNERLSFADLRNKRNEDCSQKKFTKQGLKENRAFINPQKECISEQNMEFFQSLSSKSSQFSLLQSKNIHSINVFPPYHSTKKESCNLASKISTPKQKLKHQQHLKSLDSKSQQKCTIQLQKLQEKVTNLEQQNKNLKSELQKKEKQIAGYIINDSACILNEEKTRKFSWTSYLFGEDQPVLDENGKKLNSLNKTAASKPQQLIKMDRFKNEMGQLETVGGKRLIKNKDLLMRTENIEIGFLFQLEKGIGKVTFYITPEKDLNNLKYKLVLKDNIKCSETSETMQRIPKKKQKKITFNFKVTPPYLLPKIMLSYQLQGNSYNHQAILPISYNKFVTFQQKTSDIASQITIRKKTHIQMLNKKLFSNKESFYQYFNCQPCKHDNKEQQKLKCSVIIQSKVLNILFTILNEDFFQIQYSTRQQNQQIVDFAEFFVMTLLTIVKN